MPGVPSVRAKFTQLTLSDLRGLGEDRCNRIRKVMNPESLTRIEGAGGLSWIPIELDVELTRAMFLVLGHEAACRHFRDNLAKAAETPILHSFVQGALRLFGLTPASLVKITPKGWRQIFRNCGEFEAELPGPGEAVLLGHRLPEVVTASRPWIDGAVASFEAFFALCEVEGTIDVDRSRIDEGELKLVFRWQ